MLIYTENRTGSGRIVRGSHFPATLFNLPDPDTDRPLGQLSRVERVFGNAVAHLDFLAEIQPSAVRIFITGGSWVLRDVYHVCGWFAFDFNECTVHDWQILMSMGEQRADTTVFSDLFTWIPLPIATSRNSYAACSYTFACVMEARGFGYGFKVHIHLCANICWSILCTRQCGILLGRFDRTSISYSDDACYWFNDLMTCLIVWISYTRNENTIIYKTCYLTRAT